MRFKLLLLFVLTSFAFYAQQEGVWLHPNRGQWDERILYKAEAISGEMYLEKNGFHYFFHNASEVYHQGHGHSSSTHTHSHSHSESELKGHSIRMNLVGSNENALKIESDSSSFYRNYFLGNDRSIWKSSVKSVAQVEYKSIYPGIDFTTKAKNDLIQYSFLVQTNTNPSLIQFEIQGGDKVFLDKKGNLHIKHSFGEIQHSAPKAWNIDASGNKKAVKIKFKLNKNNLSFEFPEGFDSNSSLYIDPDITFSTFTGATSDNWGFTAAPDKNGNAFAGGIVFGAGYPTTPGAFDITYNGAGSNPGFDVSISKFNASGTALIYSTFLGGAGSETPNSIICNDQNELFIFGVTSSANFPMGGSSQFDNIFKGGPSENQNNLNFPSGTDLYVARLNAAGTVLIASTFVGGTGTEGLNIGALRFNYGDQFRGEIIIDNFGNPIVSSTTRSVNFPTVNAFQNTLNGQQDAVVFKLNPELNNMLFSSYFGGSGLESGNSITVNSSNELYVSGGTNSTNLNFTNGHTLSYQGGIGDGYLFRLGAGNNPTVINGTYIGSNEYDQVYFVQTDVSDNVYILGQTEAFMPITPGVYGNPNSGQFIRKYTPDLLTMQWNTTIGAGSGHVEISPTAFLVSDCNEIYLSGWGGTLNSNSSVSQAVNSSSNGMPVTPDAYQSTTTGNNFYIAVLGQDAQTLKYGTFMGGMSNVSPNHVDGGTSRFDKSGFMYHSVCASCGASNTGFSTTPGAYSTTSQSNNCNLAIFKFELNKIEAIIGEPEPLICLPDMVHFVNNSANGNTFNWDFGDGNTSLLENPSHLYDGPGNYTVTLVVSDSSGCFSPDSVTFQINLGIYSGEVNSISSAICPGTPFQLEASGGTSYLWSPANVLDNPTIANPTATVFETTTFSVIISDECGVDTLEVVLPVFSANAQASNDTSICIGNSVPLFATGGGTYLWSPSDYLDNPTSATPTSTPTETITYTIDIVTPNGCELTENVQIQVFYTPPIPVIPDTVLVCRGGSKQITVSGADTYIWDFNPIITPLNSPTITITPSTDQWLYCNFFNACGLARDSVFVKIVDPSITVSPDTIICPGKVAMLVASGGVSYQWFPTIGLNTALNDTVYASPNQTTTYQVIGEDQNGCVDSAIVTVGIFPTPFIQTVPDVHAFFGDQIVLDATSSSPGVIYWSPAEFLSCVVCLNPIANPNKNFTYTVYFTDMNGCQASDNVHIYYDAIIYIPNTFTPNNSMLNEIFKAEGGNIKHFKLTIYNRWGEKIKILTSLDDYWDGTYKGIPCQDGTYVWKLEYTDFSENEFKRVGHINLLR